MKHVDFLSANEIFDISIVIMIILFALEHYIILEQENILEYKRLMLIFRYLY